jgi:hypothetical protein
MKKCSRCKVEKEESEFCPSKTNTTTGLYSYCKDCSREYARERRRKHPEKVRAENKRWRDANPKKVKEMDRRRYEKHSEKIKARVNRYREQNPEKVRALKQKWYEENAEEIKERGAARWRSEPERQYFIQKRSSAKRKGIPWNLEPEDLIFPTHCSVLGIPLEFNRGRKKGHSQVNSYSLDRIDPKGGYVKGNVIIVSHLANTIKSNATPDQILAVGNFYKKLEEEGRKNGNSDDV